MPDMAEPKGPHVTGMGPMLGYHCKNSSIFHRQHGSLIKLNLENFQ